MSWNLLLTAIRSRATSDTGSGGLFETGAAMITGWYALLAPQSESATEPYPYVVVSPVSAVRANAFDSTKLANEYQIQASVWTASGIALTSGQAIVDRIIARFDRWAPTVTGYSASQLICETPDGIIEDDLSRQHIVEFRCLLGKA